MSKSVVTKVDPLKALDQYTKTKPSIQYRPVIQTDVPRSNNDESRKKTAKELLEKIRKKRETELSKTDKATPIIGKMPNLAKLKKSKSKTSKEKNDDDDSKNIKSDASDPTTQLNFYTSPEYYKYVQWFATMYGVDHNYVPYYIANYGFDQYMTQCYAQYYAQNNDESKKKLVEEPPEEVEVKKETDIPNEDKTSSKSSKSPNPGKLKKSSSSKSSKDKKESKAKEAKDAKDEKDTKNQKEVKQKKKVKDKKVKDEKKSEVEKKTKEEKKDKEVKEAKELKEVKEVKPENHMSATQINNNYMTADYQYYVQWYMNAYGVDLSTAQYYSQYYMTTNGEYQPEDVSSWLSLRGFNVVNPAIVPLSTNLVVDSSFTSKSSVDKNEPIKKDIDDEMDIDASEALEDSEIVTKEAVDGHNNTDSDLLTVNVNNDNNNCESTNFDPSASEENKSCSDATAIKLESEQYCESVVKKEEEDEEEKREEKDEQSSDKAISEANKIHVIVPSTPLSANEMLLHNEFRRVDTLHGNSSPPPPPPPPIRPKMTHLIADHCILLPNGQKLPPGTEQIIIHPYPTSHPFSDKFSAQNYEKAYEESSLPTFMSSKQSLTATPSANVND